MASLTLRKTSIITGAAAGIGRSTALRFADFGGENYLLVDLNEDGLQETKNLILQAHPSASILTFTRDTSADDAAGEIVQAAVDAFGRIDYLVNVAGTPGGFYKATEVPIETWDRVQRVNVRGTYFLQRAAIQQMLKQDTVDQERGSIVNIGSMVSHIAVPMLSAYVTSKHAVLGMTRAEALDFAADGIRVNCVAPGLIQTNLGSGLPDNTSKVVLEGVLDKTPMGRFGKPEEVANCVAFLCSSLASYVTGASLAVDGCFTAV